MAKTRNAVKALVIRDLPPVYRTAFRTLAVMWNMTYADLLVRLMVQSRNPTVREVVPRDGAHRPRPAPAGPAATAAGR